MRKIMHMFIAFVLLVSTTGMTVNLHFCKGHLHDMGLNKPAESCCDMRSHDHPFVPGFYKDMPCHCSNLSINIYLSDDYLESTGYSDNPDIKCNVILLPCDQHATRVTSSDIIAESVRKFSIPPPPQKALLSEIQSYLI